MKRFRRLYLIEPAHDFTVAKLYTDQVIFVTTGEERVEELQGKITESLSDFCPTTDALIPMGKSSACLMTGLILPTLSLFGASVNIGVFRGDSYEFYEVTL